MEELVELGLEGINYVTDKYHDAVYDGVGKVGPWVGKRTTRIRGRSVKRSASQGKKTASPTTPTSRKMKDDYYSDEDRGRRNSLRERDRDSGYYGERDRVEEWARRSQGGHSPPPRIKVNGSSHIYPPPPQAMHPPYPTAGQLLPMPPDAPYPLQRSHSDARRDPRSRSLIPQDQDYDYGRGRGLMTRSRSANHGRARSRSWSCSRSRSRSHDRRERHKRLSGRHERDIDNPHHSSKRFNHVTAGLAGALAGGLLGREVSKGDTVATVAGALVGALGAGVAEKEWERHRDRHKMEDKAWEGSYGRR